MLRLALRAAMLDGGIYGEIRDRQETAFSALGTVLVAGIAFGLGMWSQTQDPTQQGFRIEESVNLVLAVSCIFTSWVVWTVFVWLLAAVLFAGSEGYRASLRALGVCYLPLSLWALIGVPAVGSVLFMLGSMLTLASAVVAVKNTHDLAWWKAGIAAGIGWFWSVIIIPLFLVILPLLSGAPS